MDASTPLPSLLSYALVAFTIELDNEVDHAMPHRTTRHGGTGGGPWLVSGAMWWNCMRYVDTDGISLGDLFRLARTKTNVNGMLRWGYMRLDEGGAGMDRVVRATALGMRAREIWAVTFPTIEARWRSRFGRDRVEELRDAAIQLIDAIGLALPNCMPILGYGLGIGRTRRAKLSAPETTDGLTVDALLAKVLVAFTEEFEHESRQSAAMVLNVSSLIEEEPRRISDLPRLTGISKEALAVASGWLVRHGLAIEGIDAIQPRRRTIRLSPEGVDITRADRRLVDDVEERWRSHFGPATVNRLRAALLPIVGDGSAEGSPLFAGLTPKSTGWRAKVPRPLQLPRYPTVLHRGGYPDGS